MKLIIFAGGSGKRFWPISRVDLPKQFVEIKDNTSTLQLSINRIQPVYGWHNIFISTNEKYVTKVKEQIPQISTSNIFTEPARRDVGPAVGLALVRLRKLGVKEPIFIGWADHLIKNETEFQEKLKQAEQAIMQDNCKIILWGEVPTFSNSNLGWIQISKTETDVHKFEKLIYKPEQKYADEMFNNKSGLWNTGYWISTVDYLLSIYEEFQPELYKKLVQIEQALDTPEESEVIENVYPTIEPVSFDEAVAYNLPQKDVGVIQSNMGWEDPGTLYALKKSLEATNENYIKGEGYFKNSNDSIIFNEDKNKIIVGLNLNETIVINTKDVMFITNKNGVSQIKELLEEFENSPKLKKLL